jgi:aminoglycoside phosphotransferase (APT) family kinase protein
MGTERDIATLQADLTAALRRALRASAEVAPLADAGIAPVGGTGVSHLHLAFDDVTRDGAAVVARIPLLSQWGLPPGEALAYEAACFARAAVSGRTPRLHATLPVGDLPFGALIVDRIEGLKPRLPGDMAAIARCLADLHRVPVPPAAERPPLQVQTDAVAATLAVIAEQASYLDRAPIAPEARDRLRAALARLDRLPAETAALPPVLTFVGTDTHPGNFFVLDSGDAVFLDLEKAMYGNPAIDLAHAGLYTSTMWDPAVATALDAAATRAFYDAYAEAAPTPLAEAVSAWAAPMRRLTWLRTTTWALRWTVLSAEPGSAWQGAHMPEAVRAHMERTAADYLSVETLARVERDVAMA